MPDKQLRDQGLRPVSDRDDSNWNVGENLRNCNVGESWSRNWGGHNWMNRVGLSSLRESDEASEDAISTTPTPDDAGDLSEVTDEKVESLASDEALAKLQQRRAMRRRALAQKFNKADTIRTGGRGATNYA